jgi:alkylation response protein AidB-like acyl-CoA dehydrogenase
VDLNDTPEQAAFRARVRAWLEEHRHESPSPVRSLHIDDPAPYRRWMSKLADAGLVGVTWPAEFGGGGMSPLEDLIVGAEIARSGCSGIIDHIAIGNIGPTIYTYGTVEQKSRYLSLMLHGDEGWCQLFSEPGAGSDLGAIATRAQRGEDGWRVSGQKVWTTMAQYADFGLMLARTDPDVPKHRGLTMFVVPMKAEGVTVVPLRLISGDAPFNEVFLDDVHLDADAALGPVDGGWGVAMTTLMYERLAVLAVFEQLAPDPAAMLAPFVDHPLVSDVSVRRRAAALALEVQALRFTAYRAVSALLDGRIPGPEAGLGKMAVIEAGRKAAELGAELVGPAGLAGELGELAAEMPGMRSAGGTEEILRNTIGDRVLGLPAEPRIDKTLPFSELGGAARRAEHLAI